MKFLKIAGLIILVLPLGCGPAPDRQAILHTSMGDLKVRLYGSTPRETGEFVRLAKAGDSLVFSFVERDFIVRAGLPGSGWGMKLDSSRKGSPPEGALPTRGTLAMLPAGAKEAGAAQESSFFINVGSVLNQASLEAWEKRLGVSFTPEQRRRFLERGGLPSLTGQCVVFGEIVEGMEVADRIAAVPRRADGRPLQDISLKINLME